MLRKHIEFFRRHDEIITSSYEKLKTQPANAFTMESVAADLGVSRATLYQHFAHKDDLLAQHILRRNQRILTLFLPFTGEQVNRELLMNLVEEYMRFCLENPEANRIHKDCAATIRKDNLHESTRWHLEWLREQRIQLLVKLISSAQAAGILMKTEPHALLAAVWGMIEGALDILLAGHFRDSVRDAESYRHLVQTILFRGLNMAADGGQPSHPYHQFNKEEI